MSKVKTVMLALAAVMVVGAVGASAASAAHVWNVKGAQLATGTTRTITAKTVAGTSWELRAGTITILCETMELAAGTIKNVEELNAQEVAVVHGVDEGKVKFTKCSSNCGTKAVAEPIETLGNKTDLADNAGTAVDVFRPNASKQFAKVTAAGCFPETTTVEGSGVAAEIAEPTTEKITHKMIFPCPPIEEAVSWNGTKETFSLTAFGFVGAQFCGQAEAKVSNAGIEENWSVK